MYEFARWIYRLIARKQQAYGGQAKDIILLLYATHWQFFPSEGVAECLRSFCRRRDRTSLPPRRCVGEAAGSDESVARILRAEKQRERDFDVPPVLGERVREEHAPTPIS